MFRTPIFSIVKPRQHNNSNDTQIHRNGDCLPGRFPADSQSQRDRELFFPRTHTFTHTLPHTSYQHILLIAQCLRAATPASRSLNWRPHSLALSNPRVPAPRVTISKYSEPVAWTGANNPSLGRGGSNPPGLSATGSFAVDGQFP